MIRNFFRGKTGPARRALLCAVGLAFAPALSGRAESVVIGALGDYGSAATGSFWATNELLVANLIKSCQSRECL